jgi:hypothetical protein
MYGFVELERKMNTPFLTVGSLIWFRVVRNCAESFLDCKEKDLEGLVGDIRWKELCKYSTGSSDREE